jgi:hypothetical protein
MPEHGNDWSPEDRELIAWFHRNRDRLPRKRFTLSPGVVVSDVNRFLEILECDIRSGTNGPRGRRGAVQDDLRRLHELFGDRIIGGDVQKKLAVGLEAAAL